MNRFPPLKRRQTKHILSHNYALVDQINVNLSSGFNKSVDVSLTASFS